MIPVRVPRIERDAAELIARLEAALPSLFEPHTPTREPLPYAYPYTCRLHEVKGNSPTSYPRICWFGGETVRPATVESQSMTRGLPRRDPPTDGRRMHLPVGG